MRRRTIAVILALAVGLGVLTGRYVLPARSTTSTAASAPTSAPAPTSASTSPSASTSASASAASPSATPSSPAAGSPAPKPDDGPMTYHHLLAAAEFAKVGISRRIYVRDRFGDGNYANEACTGVKTLSETLGGPGAYFRGLITSSDTADPDPTLAVDPADQVAREVAADAGSPAMARNFTDRLLLEEAACQIEPAGHWVYGPTQTITVAPDIAASWMGSYTGDLNTAGAAPPDKEPCGGIAVLRNGSHYGIMQIGSCLGTDAMNRIVRAAVSQL